EHQPRVGGRKLHQEMNARQIDIGRDRLFDCLRQNELLVRKKRSFHCTTWSKHGFRTYCNLIKNQSVTRTGQVLVSDITYIDTREGFCYLSLVTDLYSRKIIGYSIDDNLMVEGTLEALRMAIQALPNTHGTIHHSDRGVQYCSRAYIEVLDNHQI